MSSIHQSNQGNVSSAYFHSCLCVQWFQSLFCPQRFKQDGKLHLGKVTSDYLISFKVLKYKNLSPIYWLHNCTHSEYSSVCRHKAWATCLSDLESGHEHPDWVKPQEFKEPPEVSILSQIRIEHNQNDNNITASSAAEEEKNSRKRPLTPSQGTWKAILIFWSRKTEAKMCTCNGFLKEIEPGDRWVCLWGSGYFRILAPLIMEILKFKTTEQ